MGSIQSYSTGLRDFAFLGWDSAFDELSGRPAVGVRGKAAPLGRNELGEELCEEMTKARHYHLSISLGFLALSGGTAQCCTS